MSNRYSYNKDFFKEINNEVKAYWLGFLYADGSITRFYKNEELRSMSLELTLKSSDEGHLFRFLKDLEANVPIQTRKNKIKDKTYESKRVVINYTKMCRDLINLGCTPAKSLTLTFPTNEQVPEHLIHHFIRGYFDGDGCVHFSENMQFHKHRNKEYLQKSFVSSIVGTYEMLNSIKEILHNNNIKSSEISKGNVGKAFEIRIHGCNNLKNFYEYLYKESTVRLKRKEEIFTYAFNKFKIA